MNSLKFYDITYIHFEQNSSFHWQIFFFILQKPLNCA